MSTPVAIQQACKELQRCRRVYFVTVGSGDIMPILLWLLGVPISVIILLMLFGFLR